MQTSRTFIGFLKVVLPIGVLAGASFAAFTMFVATMFRHHLPQHILIWLGVMSAPEEVIDSWGNPERAASYMLIFVALVLLGGGRFSLDRFVKRYS